jgi:hypothetical protein
MSTIAGYYTTPEVRARFDWTRAQVAATARREGWPSVRVGQSLLWAADAVDAYATARTRTTLLKALGWRARVGGAQLARATEGDLPCSECGAFAVRLADTWRCTEGHGGTG